MPDSKDYTKKKERKRYKEVSIPLEIYEVYRLGECQLVIDLLDTFHNMYKNQFNLGFKLSCPMTLLLFKIQLGIDYRGIASDTKDLQTYQIFGMK